MGPTYIDIRHSLRSLLRAPTFSVTAVLMLALVVGGASSIFSAVSAYLLRPLPVEGAERLVVLAAKRRGRKVLTNLSYPNFKDTRDRNTVFSDLVGYIPINPGLSNERFSEKVWGQAVSGNFFGFLGVRPPVGRSFTVAEDQFSGASRVVVLSHNLWANRLGADEGILGKSIRLNGYLFTVVGVVPSWFQGTDGLLRADLWVPLAPARETCGVVLDNRAGNNLHVLGRLKPGMTLKQAQATIDLVAAQLRQEYPLANERMEMRVLPETRARPDVSTTNLVPQLASMFMGVAGVVWTIACANLATLMLGRVLSRRREVAIRLALGASRTRIVSQLLTESLVVSLVGGLLGFLISYWGTNILSHVRLPTDTPILFEVRPDRTVFVFTMLLSLATGLVFGTAPALTAWRLDIPSWLANGSRSGIGRSKARARAAVVVLQFALATVLLSATGLFIRSLRNAGNIELGFGTDNTVLLSLSPRDDGYDEERGRRVVSELVAGVRALPGVRSAGIASDVPFGFSSSSMNMLPAEEISASGFRDARVSYTVVDQGYFSTMRIPIVQGRPFNEQDRPETHPVAIVNETLGKAFWPGQSLLGKRIVEVRGNGIRGRVFEVVGVAKAGKYESPGEDPKNYVYLAYSQNYRSDMTLLVHTVADAVGMTPAIREVLRELDPNLPFFDVTTLERLVYHGKSMLPMRYAATLIGGVGFLGFALAVVGVYGLLSYYVSLQTREIGVRMALGARSGNIIRLIVGRGLRLAAMGTGTGLLASIWLTTLIRSLLLGVGAGDPLTLVVVPFVVSAVTAVACYLPARRVLAGNPITALRHE